MNVETEKDLIPKEVNKEEVVPIPEGENDLDTQSSEQDEKNWEEITGLDFNTLCVVVESIIFMSDRPISISKIKGHLRANIPLKVLYSAIEKLQNTYSNENSLHGIQIQEVAEGYQFRTKPICSKFIKEMYKSSTFVLAPTALEVLAIIAYKQPISKQEVEKIRGVDSSHIVRSLIDKRLVKIVGRSEELGRPVVYGTSNEFLELFNLRSLTELPPEHELDALINKNEIGEIPDIKTVLRNAGNEFFKDVDLEELDALEKNLKSIQSDTEFTKILKKEDQIKLKKEVTVTEGDVTETSETTEVETSTPRERKSAFDLLEEYLVYDEIKKSNLMAAESELLTSVADPVVISYKLFSPTEEENPASPEEKAENPETLVSPDIGEVKNMGEMTADEVEEEVNTIEPPSQGPEDL